MSTGISNERLMELYVHTIEQCGMFLLDMSDGEIEYIIFEELEINAISFLHDNTLLKLRKAGLITDEIAQKSSVLRERILALQDADQWNMKSVKNAKEWREVFALFADIQSLLKKQGNP